MNIHENIEEFLAAAVTDGLSPEERKNFELHLAQCEQCRALNENQKTMSTGIAETFQKIKPDENFELRIAQKFRRRSQSLRRFQLGDWLIRLPRMPVAQGLAALLLTMALIKGGQILTGEKPGQPAVISSAKTWAMHDERGYDIGGASSDQGKTETMRRLGVLPQQNLHGFNSFAGTTTVSGGTLNFQSATPAAPAATSQAQVPMIARNKEELGHENFDYRADEKHGLTSARDSDSSFGSNGAVAALKKLDAASEESKAALASDKSKQLADGQLPAAPPEQPLAPAPLQPDRKLIRNATLEFEVKNFEATVETIRAITGEEQGYVATADSARGANGKLRGTIVVKMLPANLDRFLLKLRALGELKNQRIGSEDVTKAYFDTDARLRNSRLMEQRLLDMLQKNTGKVSDLLQVEKELARVRGQIEEMQGELKYWDALVSYATVTISLYEKDLNQAAAFLLKEHANLSLFSQDVESTYAAAKSEATKAQAQVLQSKLERDANGRVSATLSLLLAPDTADQTIMRMKALGRVQTFTTQDERVAQGGSGASDTARVERDKVQFDLLISRDEESRRQTSLRLVTPHVEQSLDAAKAAALAQHAEVVSSNVTRDPSGRGSGEVTVRVPSNNYAAALEALKKIGRVASVTIQRNDRAGDDDSEPVLISMSLTSEETPVQRTNLSVLSEKVEENANALKQAAERVGAEIGNSTFERRNGGVEVANMTISLPLKQYGPLVAQIEQLGKVSNFTVHREEAQEAAGENAPAQIDVQIYSRGDIVPDESGVWATLRRTFVQAFAAVMWSLRMIGVALAFIAPWLLTLSVLAWIIARVRHARRAEK